VIAEWGKAGMGGNSSKKKTTAIFPELSDFVLPRSGPGGYQGLLKVVR